MADGYLLNKQAIEALRQDHQRLRNLVYEMKTLLRSKYRPVPQRLMATGITGTTTDYPNYPTSGNVVPVILQSWTFTESTGEQTINYATGTKAVLARTYDGTLPSEGTHVVIDRQAGRPGRRWWIRPEPAGFVRDILIRTGVSGIPRRTTNTMGSATCDLLQTTPAGVLTSIGSITVYNVSDLDVGECKVGKAAPVTTDSDSIIYVIDVESCSDIALVGGSCPSDGISTSSPASGYSRYMWDGSRWVQLAHNCNVAGGYASISPREAGTTGEIREVACSQNYCSYESDYPSGGWTFMGAAGTCNAGNCSPPTYPSTVISQQVAVTCGS